jgi:hypothetical protein
MTDLSTIGSTVLVPSNADEAIQANKLLLLEALRAAGCKTALVGYYGEGDSGSVNDVKVEPEIDLQLQVAFFAPSNHFEAGVWHVSYRKVLMPLHCALEAFADDVVVKHHEGYENGDGGSGELTFDCDSGEVRLDHRDYYVESVSTETVL